MTKPDQTICSLWGALWHSKNKIDGVTRHLIYDNCVPVLFRTRQEIRAWIREQFGYIKHRQDLRSEPFGWRMPRPVRVNISIQNASKRGQDND